MTSLTIGHLEDEVIAKLRMQAVAHGVTVEEEARLIIKQAVDRPIRLGNIALELFGKDYGVELDLPKSASHEPINFGSGSQSK
jgi:plasmid stability protein